MRRFTALAIVLTGTLLPACGDPESSPTRPPAREVNEAGAVTLEWLQGIEPERYGELTVEQLSVLEEIRIDGSEMRPGAADPLESETDLAHLESLPRLRSLKIWTTGISDMGLSKIAGLTRLETLEIGGWGVRYTDAGLEQLLVLENLEKLKLTQAPHITDEGMTVIARLPRLTHLDITYTKVTNRGLASLLDAPSLKEVSYGWAAESRRWQARFEQEHPERSFVIK